VDGYLIAVDMVDAGVGDTVLLIDEGNSSRQIFDVTWGPIRATIVGIVDDYEVA
jgi:ethanolamine utilization protein EutN